MNAVVPPDALHEANIAHYIARLRRFLTQQRIDTARQAQTARMADGNPYRRLLLAEKQPWVQAFDDFDRATMRGARPLLRRHITPDMLLAATTGQMLGRIEPTLTPAVADAMRSRLLDIDGRAHPVLMEWSAAHFYLRHGMHIEWTQPNVPGPEFVGTSAGLRFEVECKRISRNAMEKLGDRDALTVGYGVLGAMVAGHIAGDVVLDTPLTQAVPMQEVTAAVTAALAPPTVLSPLDVDVPGVGRLTGNLRRLGPGSGWAQRGDIERRLAARPHDHRGFAIAVPHPHAPHPQAVVLWLKGPRRTPEQLRDHILATVTEGAGQLSGQTLGVVMVEIEDIDEGVVYRDQPALDHINQAVFAAYPALGAVVWQTERRWVPTAEGYLMRREVAAMRNPGCIFDGTALPLRDFEVA